MTDGARKPRRPRHVSRIVKISCLAFVLAAGAVVAGFLQFAERVAEMKVPPDTVKGDAIVVLTGGYQRIEHALDLLRRGAGQRLLISGVNPATTGSEIRKLTRSTKALFACCVDIGHDAIDTVGNANETARWIREHSYKHVLLVTNNYHMPRSLLELRRVDPDTDFIPYPVINTDLKSSNWLRNSDVLRSLVSEYAKFSLASLRDMVGAVGETGLRTDQASAEEPGPPERHR
ncbi:MAG: YdcF family protein [Pararhizobium sp.]